MGQVQTISRSSDQQHESEQLTRANLPPRRHAHWLQRQKKLVVLAVQSGLLPLHEAMARYELSIEEYQSWERSFGPRRSFTGAGSHRTGTIVPLAVH